MVKKKVITIRTKSLRTHESLAIESRATEKVEILIYLFKRISER